MPLFNFYTPPTIALPGYFLILSSAYKNEHIDKKNAIETRFIAVQEETLKKIT